MSKLNITVIGGGLIGASWTALFLAHGHEVCLHDVVPDAAGRVRAALSRMRPIMEGLGLPMDPQSPRLTFEPDLAKAVRLADVVQECGPERLSFKRKLWARIERHCRPDTLLLSSSSGLTASMQAASMKSPGRMLIGHPFNPPHLMPLVEVVPGRRTDAGAIERARTFYASMGKQVVVLRKEIPGFVANRIQAAVIRESVSLLEQGVVSAKELDTAVTQSLGLRWAASGPVLSAHLGGGSGGIRAFLDQFAGGLRLLWLHARLKPVFLWNASQAALVQQVENAYGAHPIDQLASERDRKQLDLLHALNRNAPLSEPHREQKSTAPHADQNRGAP